jgi:hypothetical protein
VLSQVGAQRAQVQAPVNAAQRMMLWDVGFEIERVEQLLLTA